MIISNIIITLFRERGVTTPKSYFALSQFIAHVLHSLHPSTFTSSSITLQHHLFYMLRIWPKFHPTINLCWNCFLHSCRSSNHDAKLRCRRSRPCFMISFLLHHKFKIWVLNRRTKEEKSWHVYLLLQFVAYSEPISLLARLPIVLLSVWTKKKEEEG